MSVGRARGTRVPAGFCSSGGRPLCECLTPVRFPAGDPKAILCEGPGATRTFVPPAGCVWCTRPTAPLSTPPHTSARTPHRRPDTWRRPGRGRLAQNVHPRSPAHNSRSHPPMRSKRLLAAGLIVLAVAACTSSTPGWTYAPAPSATPVPSADPSASVAPSARRSRRRRRPRHPPRLRPAPTASGAGTVVDVSALNIAFDPTELSAPADQAFQIAFANNDARSPTTSRSRTQAEPASSRARSSRASPRAPTTYRRSRPGATSSSARSTRTWSARSRRSDRPALMTQSGEQLCYTRRLCPVGRGTGPPRRAGRGPAPGPGSNGVLPGRRRSAIRSRRPRSHSRRALVDGPRRAEERRRDRPRARAWPRMSRRPSATSSRSTSTGRGALP